MHSFVAALALTGAASASVLKRTHGCCFEVTASGSPGGPVGQIPDGQNRVGGHLDAATYCIDNGKITDASGRGCILTPPTMQFQCDMGASPTSGFSLSSSGNIEYNGDSTFYVCGATPEQYNIYTTPVKNQADCEKVTLMATHTNGQCPLNSASSSMASSTAPATVMETKTLTTTKSACPATSADNMGSDASSSTMMTSAAPPASSGMQSYPASMPAMSMSKSAPMSSASESKPAMSMSSASESKPAMSMPAMSMSKSAPMSSAPASKPAMSMSAGKPSACPSKTAKASACPTSLTGAYQTPHLIVPVNSEHPDVAYGTQYNGTVNHEVSTIFNFDIPQSYAGKQCSLIFLFPEQKDLVTSSFDFNNMGSLGFCELSKTANQQTTYNNKPMCEMDGGSVAVMPGNSYVIATYPCAAGMKESIEVKSEDGLSLEFFQDYNPSPIGLYITSC